VSVLRVTGFSDGPTMTPMDAHDMSPDTVLDLVRSLGGALGEILVVTCEPLDVGTNLGLSDEVLAAVDPAVEAVERLLMDERLSEKRTPC
jgi:hydrogenase maturation protease